MIHHRVAPNSTDRT